MRDRDQAADLIKAGAVLAVLELVCFAPFASGMGFYHDDWAILERLASGGGFWGSARALMSAGYWARPVEIVQFPLFFALAGYHAPAHQALLLALDAVGGLLLYALLRRLLGRRDVALTAAALALVYPNHGATHHWFSNSPQLVAVDLALASMIFHHRWLESGRRRTLGAAIACYAASVLCYESAAFLPLLSAGALAAGHLASGLSARQTAHRLGAAMLPYAVAFAGALAWQRAGAPWLLGQGNPKAAAFSAGHAAAVAKAGFECVTTRVAWLCSLTLRYALADFGRGMAALWIAVVAAAAALWSRVDPEGAAGSRRACAAAAGGALGCFVGAYLPYVFAADYTPAILGVINRLNAAGGVAGGLLCAALIHSASSLLARPAAARGARGLAMALLLGAFTWTNWEVALQWNRSWALQREILSKVAARLAAVKEPAAVILAGAPQYVNGVPVFAANWDFGAALRFWTRRRELQGNVLTSHVKIEAGKVFDVDEGGAARELAYVNPHVYYFDRDVLVPIRR